MQQHEQRQQQRLDLRARLRAQRDALSDKELNAAESGLLKQLRIFWPKVSTTTNFSANKKSLKVAGYLASGGEISLASSLLWLRRSGHTTYLPVVREKLLMFAKLDESTRFTKGKYDIDIPDIANESLLAANKLDVVLMPLVGFDLQGGRIGMGGGYYDRTLEFTLIPDNKHKPQLLGIGHEWQRQDRIPVEPWDVPLSGIVTDQASYDIL